MNRAFYCMCFCVSFFVSACLPGGQLDNENQTLVELPPRLSVSDIELPERPGAGPISGLPTPIVVLAQPPEQGTELPPPVEPPVENELSAGGPGSCVEPLEIGALPFVANGDVDTSWEMYKQSCPRSLPVHPLLPAATTSVWSRAQVWRFVPPATGTFDFSVNTGRLFVTTTCECEEPDCLAIDEGGFLQVPLVAGFPVDLVALTNPGETYNFTVHGLCVPNCDGRSCGSDGCMGSCGSCGDQEDCLEDSCLSWDKTYSLANNGACDEPFYCSIGTDCSDCGTCGAEQGFMAQCVPALAGNTCENAIVVDALPFEFQGNTTGYDDNYLFGTKNTGGYPWSACPEPTSGMKGHRAPDMTYRFTPDVSGFYDVELSSESKKSTFVVTTDCTAIDGGCVGGGIQKHYTSPGKFNGWLEAGTDYFIIVDGNRNFERGPHTLKVSEACVPNCDNAQCGGDGCGNSCGSCDEGSFCVAETGQCALHEVQEGNSCETAIEVGGTPFEVTQTGPIYSTDLYGGDSPEQVYSITPSVSGVYTLQARRPGAWGFQQHMHITVTSDCEDVEGTTIAAGKSNHLKISMDAGTTYYVLVETLENPANFSYIFSVSQVCVPDCGSKVCGSNSCGTSCGTCDDGFLCNPGPGTCHATNWGDSCSQAIPVSGLPFSATVMPKALHDNYKVDANDCDQKIVIAGGAANPDMDDAVYRFTPPQSGDYTFRVTDNEGHMLMGSGIAVVTDCSALSTSCLAKHTSFMCGPEFSSYELVVPLEAGVEVFLIVEASFPQAGPDSNASLNFTVSEACIPQCDGKQCGDNGCGRPCGTCQAGSACSDEGVCELIFGDSCDSPYPISSVPFEIDGETQSGTNTYVLGAETGCNETKKYAQQETSGPDDFYRFTAPYSGHFKFRVRRPDEVSAMYGIPSISLFNSCGDPQEGCESLGYRYSFNGAHAVRFLEAGQELYVAIDSKQKTQYRLNVEEMIFPALSLNEWVPGEFIEIRNRDTKSVSLQNIRLDMVGKESGVVHASWMLKDIAPGLHAQDILVLGNTPEVKLFPTEKQAIFKLKKGYILKAEMPTAEEPLVAQIVWNDQDVLLDELHEPTNADFSTSMCGNVWIPDLVDTPGKANSCCSLE